MKFDRNAKIEEAVSKDASRYAITEPYFDGENLVATDGHIMVDFIENHPPKVAVTTDAGFELYLRPELLIVQEKSEVSNA